MPVLFRWILNAFTWSDASGIRRQARGGMRPLLIPIGHRRVIIGTVNLFAINSSLILDIDTQRALKAHWVRDVPPVKSVLAGFHLNVAHIAMRIKRADLPTCPGAPIFVLGTGCMRNLFPIDCEDSVALAPPTGIVRMHLEDVTNVLTRTFNVKDVMHAVCGV
jgi:hypothetical protein